MFTGIIGKMSTIEKIQFDEKSKNMVVRVLFPQEWKIKEGNSISINGICSTVSALSKKEFEVEYMEETQEKTTTRFWKNGDKVNLEKSLKMRDLLDGHLVLGHVDARGEIIDIKKKTSSIILKIKIPKKYVKFIAEKGSVAVDGVSLTVVSQKGDWFTVSLVRYTLENTNLKKLRSGDKVNIETDILAKYATKKRKV